MKQNILVATDGSDAAIEALDLAAELAANFGSTLTIGHVLQFGRSSEELARMAEIEHMTGTIHKAGDVDFNILGPAGGDVYADTRPTENSVRVITLIGDEILKRAADRAKDKGAATVKTKSASGDPADKILDVAQEVGADLIVIGHRGLGRVKRALLGSVAYKVTQNAECSVLTVR